MNFIYFGVVLDLDHILDRPKNREKYWRKKAKKTHLISRGVTFEKLLVNIVQTNREKCIFVSLLCLHMEATKTGRVCCIWSRTRGQK
jgi:hypothetical protein